MFVKWLCFVSRRLPAFWSAEKTGLSGPVWLHSTHPHPHPTAGAGRQRTADSSRCSCDRHSSLSCSLSQARVDTFRGSFWEGYQVGTPALPVHRWNSQGDTGQEWSDRLGQIRSQTSCTGPGLFGQQGQNVVGFAMSHTTAACPPPPPVPDLQEGLLCPALASSVLWPSFPLSYRPLPLSLC